MFLLKIQSDSHKNTDLIANNLKLSHFYYLFLK